MGAGLTTFEQNAGLAIGAGTGRVSVSSDSSNFDTSTQVGDWLVVSSKNAGKDSDSAVLTFNPSTSRAVCAGVGYALNRVLGKQNLGEAADRDPLRFYSVLRYTLGLPPSHVTTLSSKSSEYAATLPNIVDFLSEAAGEVGEDGLLFFSFSGHGQVRTNVNGRKSTILVTADSYGSDTKSVLSAENLEYCLKDTKAKYVVIMLDCCHAGMMANSLAEDSIQTQAQLYVLAACSKSEVSMCHPELGSGFFTFFMTDYLAQHAERGRLPISSVLQHTQNLCPAVASLCVRSEREMAQKPAKTDTIMHPLLRIKLPFSVRSGEENASLDTVDAALRMFESDSVLTAEFLSRFVTDSGSQVFDRVPNTISDWLIMVAMPAIRTLYHHGYLSPSHSEYKEVLKMVVCLLSRTVGSMFVDIGSGEAGDPDLFLALVFFVQQAIVQAVDEEAKERQGASPDLEKPTILCYHAVLGLHHYVVGMAKALACDPGSLRKLLQLVVDMKNHMEEADEVAVRRASSTRQHWVSSGAESAALPTGTTAADQPDSAPLSSSRTPMTNIDDVVAAVKKTLDDIPRLDDVIDAPPTVEWHDTFSHLA